MNNITTYDGAVRYLNRIYDLLNARFFESSLSKPTITIYATPRAYGHFTLSENTWVSANGGTHEINIDAGTLGRPIKNVVATLLHEMVHYYNYIHHISDCSRGGKYHNHHFKEAAEAHGLIVHHNDKNGWSKTEPSEERLEFVSANNLTDILIHRNVRKTSSKKKSSSRKYVCPCCGISVRATKEVSIACVKCSQIMRLQQKKA